jgi:hypothetical protein
MTPRKRLPLLNVQALKKLREKLRGVLLLLCRQHPPALHLLPPALPPALPSLLWAARS